MNTSIVPTIERNGSDLVVSSEQIALGADVQHKNVLELIAKYEERINRFGQVAFETRAGYNNAQVRVALLNEQQSTLIMSFMRNTERVMDFKEALVKGFYELARTVNKPLSPDEIVEQALAITAARVKELNSYIEVIEPKANAWDSIVSSAGSWSYNDAAKVLCEEGQIQIGEKRLVSRLIDWGFLYRDAKGRPHVYQKDLERGWFTVKARTYRDHVTGEERESSAPQVRLTGSGLDMVRTRLLGESNVA
ncbi:MULTISPECIES: phage antirepressor KilAC domain-containing protein [unclassified Glutamicibacter]|uniref:phage antirepressor KilAC domain-containing protein n=1 Tax=unclassified Glutamicibacter TaxID=2627139 RepID=UPI003828C59C